MKRQLSLIFMTLLMVLPLMSFLPGEAPMQKTVYYVYARSFSAANMAMYYTEVFPVTVKNANDDDDTYHITNAARLATGRLEADFSSYLYSQKNSGRTVTSAFYFETAGEAQDHKNSSMNLEKAGGKSVSTMIYYNFRFNKDQ